MRGEWNHCGGEVRERGMTPASSSFVHRPSRVRVFSLEAILLRGAACGRAAYGVAQVQPWSTQP